jgi:biotin transport system substrate-specific component
MSLRKKMLVSLFASLLCVSSYIILPIGPVPVTLQVLFVLLSGVILGAELGALSVVIWILLGVFGLPVFAGGKAGPLVLLGPTGGYLLGFVVCSWLVGTMTRSPILSRIRIGFAMLLGLTAAYGLGLAGFMASFAFFLQKPMTMQQAMSLSVFPFVPFDIVKVALGAWLAPTLLEALGRAGFVEGRQNIS